MNFFQLPTYGEHVMYGAVIGDYQFVISSFEGEFRGSWKLKAHRDKPAVFLDGNPFKTYQECEAACRHAYKALTNKN